MYLEIFFHHNVFTRGSTSPNLLNYNSILSIINCQNQNLSGCVWIKDLMRENEMEMEMEMEMENVDDLMVPNGWFV